MGQILRNRACKRTDTSLWRKQQHTTWTTLPVYGDCRDQCELSLSLKQLRTKPVPPYTSVSICMLHVVVLSTSTQKIYFYFLIASNFISTGCNHVGSLDLYQWRAEKGQLMTYLPHAGLVHDITTADCWAQNGSTHCDFFPYFQTSIFNKHDKKLCAKLLCVYFLFHFYWLGLWYLLGSIPL